MDNTQPLRPPSVLLPPIKRAVMLSAVQIEGLVSQLSRIYTPQVLGTQFTVATPQIRTSPRGNGWVGQKRNRVLHDSGYASVVISEDEDDNYKDDQDALQAAVQSLADNLETAKVDSSAEQPTELDRLRADEFERACAMKWLTGLISRSEEWIDTAGDDADDTLRRESVVEKASALLAACSGSSASGALTRAFTFSPKFPVTSHESSAPPSFQIQLKDDSLPSQDHTAVGLQTWGSAPILCQLIAKAPSRFALDLGQRSLNTHMVSMASKLRVLELGAGTGLLSIFIWRLLEYQMLHIPTSAVRAWKEVSVDATDYHPSVLSNLAFNLALNRPSMSPKDTSQHPTLFAKTLDWIDCQEPDESEKYDIVFGADIVYEPEHAPLIKAVVEKVLRKPRVGQHDGVPTESTDRGGVFWLMYPIRPTHSAEVRSIEEAFGETPIGSKDGDGWKLGLLEVQRLERSKGIGRADEVSYRLLKIGWL